MKAAMPPKAAGFQECAKNNLRAGAITLLAVAQLIAPLGAQAAPAQDTTSTEAGPIRLQQPARSGADGQQSGETLPTQQQQLQIKQERPAPYKASDFELYVQRVVGDDASLEVKIRRFGTELMSNANRSSSAQATSSSVQAASSSAQETSSQIPQDYVISVGDEVLVTLWGSVEADLRQVVDRSGRITLPRVGPVMVAGLRYDDLVRAIDQRVALVFRNYKLSASLGRLRSIRIYVTGFTQRPGAYTVSSLATLVNALMQTGGPSGAGSFRQIELRRGGKPVSRFDFYDLLIKGDKSADITLQAEDVIHIGPIGPQVALIGSVNNPAIFELKAGETMDDLLAMAGGFTAVADRSRLSVEHLDARNDTRISELALPQQGKQQLRSGDLLRAFSAVDVALPQFKQSKRVKVEGEVLRPGEFILPANSSIADAIKAAGGLAPGAYLFGTDFSRETVRIAQQENYDRTLRDLETEFTRAATAQKAISADEASVRAQGSTKLIERLRAIRPTGRIVLQLNPGTTSLPELALEDGDRLLIPVRPTTVGVFGSVFNGGSYLWKEGSSVEDILKLAGGPTKGADSGSTFVLRANGSVASSRLGNSSGWLSFGSALSATPALPGDTVFVPEELNKTTFIQEAKEWAQILYQFGLGAAALKTIRQ